MSSTSSNIVGASIRTGRTGKRPVITHVLWQGTADCQGYGLDHRIPSALVETERHGTMAVIFVGGFVDRGPEWMDARLRWTREWEDEAGDLVEGADAYAIDIALKHGWTGLEAERQALDNLIADGKFAIGAEADRA